MGFQFIDANYETHNGKVPTGEIDLIFVYDKFLFLIEVTTDNHDRTRKKITYFSKWSTDSSIQKLRQKYDLPTKKIIRILNIEGDHRIQFLESVKNDFLHKSKFFD